MKGENIMGYQEGYSLADIAAATGNTGCNHNGGLFGGDGSW